MLSPLDSCGTFVGVMKAKQVFLLMLLPVSGPAQNCDAILGYTRDISTVSSRSHFKQFFCNQTFSSYQDAHDKGVSVGIPIDGLPVTFGGHDRSSSWSQYKQSICDSVSADSSLDISITTADAKVVDAWTNCLQAPGVHFWAEPNAGDASLVDLVAKFNGIANLTDALRCPITLEPKGKLTHDESRVSCVRAGGARLRAANVTLPTSAGTRSVKFTPSVPDPIYRDGVAQASFVCTKLRIDMIGDGPKIGDKHIVHIECPAPGKVTRVVYGTCTGGACGFLDQIPSRSGPCLTGNMTGCFSYATNSADPVTVTGTVFYERPTRECIKYCGPI